MATIKCTPSVSVGSKLINAICFAGVPSYSNPGDVSNYAVPFAAQIDSTSSLSNGVYTAPYTGYYRISLHGTNTSTVAANAQFNLQYQAVGGSYVDLNPYLMRIVTAPNQASATTPVLSTMLVTMSLDAGGKIRIRPTSTNFKLSDNNNTYMSIEQIR